MLDAWGFEPKTLVTWAKDRDGHGTGCAARPSTCIMAVRGKPIVTLTNQTTLLHAPIARALGEAGRVLRLVESLCPAPRYADLFSRYRHNESGIATATRRRRRGGRRMSTRMRFANRRASKDLHPSVRAALLHRNGLGFPGTGRLAEIFLGNGRAGSDIDAAAKDSAVVASLAMQHGVPVDVIRKALLRDSQGKASRRSARALDAIARAAMQSHYSS